MSEPLPKPGAYMVDRDGDVYEIEGPRDLHAVNFLVIRCMVAEKGFETAESWRLLTREYGIRYMTPREVAAWQRVRRRGREILGGKVGARYA
jgi:hypothetical protein